MSECGECVCGWVGGCDVSVVCGSVRACVCVGACVRACVWVVGGCVRECGVGGGVSA